MSGTPALDNSSAKDISHPNMRNPLVRGNNFSPHSRIGLPADRDALHAASNSAYPHGARGSELNQPVSSASATPSV